jgi:tetratricopeptide (TPR) repeat protein
MEEDTRRDVNEFDLWKQGLHERGERARDLRKAGHHIEAEKTLSELLMECEEICGEHSRHLSDFLKSLGILYHQQGRRQDAVKAFTRMDRLRYCAGTEVLEEQRASDLEYLFESQRAVQRYADANITVQRMRASIHIISRDTIDALHQQTVGKANVEVCATCGHKNIGSKLLLCSACRTAHYCNRGC